MNWSQSIEIGDILYCLFPFDKITKEPGLSPHYVLVLDVDLKNGKLPKYLTVAYGTSKKTGINEIYQSELLVTEERCLSFSDSGLSKTTKFDLKNTMYLPYNKDYFIINPKKKWLNPKQGSIDFDCNDNVSNQMRNISAYLISIGYLN